VANWLKIIDFSGHLSFPIASISTFTFLNFAKSSMMLPMLEPIGKTARVEIPSQIHGVNGPVSRRFNDQIVSVRRPSPILKWFKNLFSKIWLWMQKARILSGVRNLLYKVSIWLRENVFAFFEDETAKRKLFELKIDKFRRVYYEMLGGKSEAGCQKVKAKFKKLPSEVQILFKEQILCILKNDRPDLTEENLNTRLKQVLEDPFIVFDTDRPSTKKHLANHHTEPMARASYAVLSKIWQEE